MNKYKKHSKANLSANIRDPLDVYDEAHKEGLEDRAKRLTRVCNVAVKMFEMLQESDLNAEGRVTALQVLNVLHHRMGDK